MKVDSKPNIASELKTVLCGFTSLVDSVKGLWSDFTGWLFGDGERKAGKRGR